VQLWPSSEVPTSGTGIGHLRDVRRITVAHRFNLLSETVFSSSTKRILRFKSRDINAPSEVSEDSGGSEVRAVWGCSTHCY
jgi:hypothetical protein